jgi:hypothetical protein
MFDPSKNLFLYLFFTYSFLGKIAFKALFKPAGAFLTVQRYSIFHKEPNLLNYFKRKWSLFLRRARPAGSQPPNPPSPKEGFRPLPKPLANLSCVPSVASDQRSSGQGVFISVTKEKKGGQQGLSLQKKEVIGMVFAIFFVYLQSERKELVFYDESIFAKSIGNTGFFT